MAILFIDMGEKYPVYDLCYDEDMAYNDWFINLTDEEVTDYESVMKNYKRWQRKIRERVAEIES